MRLWSISPGYLDARGLLALWREALLAQKVLTGLTRGYTRHRLSLALASIILRSFMIERRDLHLAHAS
ncbi:MAG: pyrimidine dimer DNA glycosylase/endonuclease V [Acidilobus sp.]